MTGVVDLPEDEAQHLSRVLRLKAGEAIAVFDGQGREALARVASVTSRRVSVRVVEPRAAAPEPRVAVTLAQALLKSDKMDRVIRDAVMLGVAAVQPFVSRRTDVPMKAVQRRSAGSMGSHRHLVGQAMRPRGRAARVRDKGVWSGAAIDGGADAADVRRTGRRPATLPT